MRLHNGTITFTSIPGAGATFHVYLPLPVPESGVSLQGEHPLSVLPSAADLPAAANALTCQTVAYLRENYADEGLSRRQIAAHVRVSERYLTRLLCRDLGIGPWEYLTRDRIERAKGLLCITKLSVTEIATRWAITTAPISTAFSAKRPVAGPSPSVATLAEPPGMPNGILSIIRGRGTALRLPTGRPQGIALTY